MEKFFNIDKLSNTYGSVSGEEIEGKYYLRLDDYSGYTQVEITKEAFDALHEQFGDVRKQSYSYTVDFYKGVVAFGQQLTYFKTVIVESEIPLSEDAIMSQAYKLVGSYPKSHTTKINGLH